MLDDFALFDRDGLIRRVNEAAESMFGMTPAYKQTPVDERVHDRRVTGPDGRPLAADEVPGVRALHGETVQNQIIQVLAPGRDEPLWISISAVPLRGPGGDIVGAVLSSVDITKLHEAQELFEATNDQLEHRAEQLVAARDEAARRAAELDAVFDALPDAVLIFSIWMVSSADRTAGADGKARRVGLCVADDGIGFDVARVPANEFGLSIMRERARDIGAALTIDSRPGEGTRIGVVWEAK